MKTAFDDYRDKMNNLANANDAEAFYLDVLSKDCRSVATECQTVADSLDKVRDVLIALKGSLDLQQDKNQPNFTITRLTESKYRQNNEHHNRINCIVNRKDLPVKP